MQGLYGTRKRLPHDLLGVYRIQRAEQRLADAARALAFSAAVDKGEERKAKMTIDMQCGCGGAVKGGIDFCLFEFVINAECGKCGRAIRNVVMAEQQEAVLYVENWLAGADEKL